MSSDDAKTSRITVTNQGKTLSADLYSQEGLELVAGLFVKLGAEYRIMYEPRWLGIQVIQFPEDMIMMQELLWKLRPDWVIECGVAHGGSAVLYASILELIGHGRVIGVDVEVRPHNRQAIESHPISHRIELIEGSSVAPDVAAMVRARVQGAKCVVAVLDSNHSTAHVAKELEIYADLVTPGSYVVAMDGAQSFVSDIPRGKPEWKDDNPLVAIREFLKRRPDFEVDPYYTRMYITSNPQGFLRRIS